MENGVLVTQFPLPIHGEKQAQRLQDGKLGDSFSSTNTWADTSSSTSTRWRHEDTQVPLQGEAIETVTLHISIHPCWRKLVCQLSKTHSQMLQVVLGNMQELYF